MQSITRNSSEGNNSNFINNVGRHFVCLRWIDRTPGERSRALNGIGKPHLSSGFVLKIDEDSFLVTAGHVIEQIECALKNGQVLEEFKLDDAYRPGAPFKTIPLPFAYSAASKYGVNKEGIGDFAAIHLSSFYTAGLTANGVVPFEVANIGVTSEFEKYSLVGIPGELTSYSQVQNGINEKTGLVVIQVDKATSIPEHVQKQGDYFYGRLPSPKNLEVDGLHLESIVGMSGGPILGWGISNTGEDGYKLVAVQSSWWKGERIIIGCPILKFIEALQKAISERAVTSLIV